MSFNKLKSTSRGLIPVAMFMLVSSVAHSACPVSVSGLANKKFGGEIVSYSAGPNAGINLNTVFQATFNAQGTSASATSRYAQNTSGTPFTIKVSTWNSTTCTAAVVADGRTGIFVFSNSGNAIDGLWTYPDSTTYKLKAIAQ